MLVLYVDDELALLELTKIFLEKKGFTDVVTCTSAMEAIALIPSHDFNAVVSDYQMPGMDGIWLLKAIRQKWPNLPFILFTGKGREDVAIEAFRNGADSYVMKGGDVLSQYEVLANQINLAVARRTAEEAVQQNLARFNLIMNNLSEVIFMVSDVGTITYISPSIHSILGYSREEVEGRNVEDILKIWDLGPQLFATGMEGLTQSLAEMGTFLFAKTKAGIVRTLHLKSTSVLHLC